MATATAGVITPAELQQSAEYQKCSVKQRLLIDTLIVNGFDWAHAVSVAFDMKSQRNAAIYSYAVRRSPEVRAALNLFLHGGDERSIFIEELKESIRRSKPGSTARLRAQALYASMVFKVKDEAANEPDDAEEPAIPTARKIEVLPYDATKTYEVGAFVSDTDSTGAVHVGQVTEISATGRPTVVVAVKSIDGQPVISETGQATREKF
jgi:hypothetical protein